MTVFVYDSECRWCRACRAWLEPRVRVRWVAAMDWPEGQSDITAADLATSVYAIDNERVERGAAAVALALASAPARRWRRVGDALVWPGIATASEAAYRLVARHRSQLSRAVRRLRHEST